MRRQVPLALILLWLFASPASAAPTVPPGHNARADELIAGLTETLRVKIRPCPRGVEQLPGIPLVTCGKVPKKMRVDPATLRAEIDAFFEEAGSAPLETRGTADWRVDEQRGYRSFSVEEVQLDISLDAASGMMILRYPSRFEDCLETKLPYSNRDEGFTHPEVIESSRVLAEYPPEMRRKKIPGRVFLQAEIRKDGSVGEICVSFADPPGVGFEDAAIDAYRQQRYEPSRQNGEPVDVRFILYMEFKMN